MRNHVTYLPLITQFPMFEKVDVNGLNAHPFYKTLKSEKGELLGNDIKWNFAKFLLDPEGNVVSRYGPQVSPILHPELH